MREEISFLEQKDAGLGLSGTIKYLRDHSLFQNEEQFGRTNDQ
jgi:hypothetical protein